MKLNALALALTFAVVQHAQSVTAVVRDLDHVPIAVNDLELREHPAASQSRPNFSGVWKLDASKSGAVGGARGAGGGAPGGGMGGGLGLGPSADELTITQTATTMTVEERRGTTSSRLIFTIDGKKTDNTLPAGRNSGRSAAYVSQWKDGRLVTKISTIDAGNNKLEYTETRSLDADGSLVVETQSGSANSRRVVYAKVK